MHKEGERFFQKCGIQGAQSSLHVKFVPSSINVLAFQTARSGHTSHFLLFASVFPRNFEYAIKYAKAINFFVSNVFT
jgi:hypothetical protein